LVVAATSMYFVSYTQAILFALVIFILNYYKYSYEKRITGLILIAITYSLYITLKFQLKGIEFAE